MAPTVCAIVFNVRIAIRGLSTSFFKASNAVAYSFPACFLTLIKVGVTLKSTASKMEHKNEKKMEITP